MPTEQKYLYEIPEIRTGLEALLNDDPVFSKAGINTEDLTWPYFGPGLSSFIRIVCGQQVSTSAAQSIWEKVQKQLAPLTPETLLNAPDETYRIAGLSGQKTSYIKGLSQETLAGNFDIEALSALPDDKVTKAITSLKGFGPWSAEIYLMFCLARPDIWPAGDLGIQEGLRQYLGRDERPTIDETRKLGERFAPRRTAASILLWKLKALKE